jgi:hypothetical protein
MPILSDRNPFTQYVQIDIKDIAFPKVGEIEPFFGSLSLWNIDVNGSDGMIYSKITESYQFDFVSDDNLGKMWSSILCPISTEDIRGTVRNEIMLESYHRKNSRALFPVPLQLELSNIYVMLLVRTAWSNDEEIRNLYKTGEPAEKSIFRSKSERLKTEKNHLLREKAYKNVAKGRFFQSSFAFGVVPLRDVLKADNVGSPNGAALEMPLYYLDDSDLRDCILSLILR